jgi:hypothetical protein
VNYIPEFLPLTWGMLPRVWFVIPHWKYRGSSLMGRVPQSPRFNQASLFLPFNQVDESWNHTIKPKGTKLISFPYDFRGKIRTQCSQGGEL